MTPLSAEVQGASTKRIATAILRTLRPPGSAALLGAIVLATFSAAAANIAFARPQAGAKSTDASIAQVIAAVIEKGSNHMMDAAAAQGFGLGALPLPDHQVDLPEPPGGGRTAIVAATGGKNYLVLMHKKGIEAWIFSFDESGTLEQALYRRLQAGQQITKMPLDNAKPRAEAEEEFWRRWAGSGAPLPSRNAPAPR